MSGTPGAIPRGLADSKHLHHHLHKLALLWKLNVSVIVHTEKDRNARLNFKRKTQWELFVGIIAVYLRNPSGSADRLLELTREFSELVAFQRNLQHTV